MATCSSRLASYLQCIAVASIFISVAGIAAEGNLLGQAVVERTETKIAHRTGNIRIQSDSHPWSIRTAPDNSALIWLVEHADTDTVVPIPGSPIPGLGDLLVWNNSVYDSTNSEEVAYNSGHCVRTVPGKNWDCQWTLFTPAGNIAASGPFLDEENSTLAIIGGTGVYYDARGWLDVGHREPSDATLDFIYVVSFTGGVWDSEKPWAWPWPHSQTTQEAGLEF